MSMLSIHSAAAEGVALASGSAPDIPWLRIALVLIFCLLLAMLAIGFVRLRYGLPFLPDRLAKQALPSGLSTGEQGKIAITQRLPLGQNSQFVVLSRGSTHYVLHVSQQSVTEIDRYDDDAQPDSQP